eukprot:scaffold91366_cov27-Tisochrysis_lutea.AAC.2
MTPRPARAGQPSSRSSAPSAIAIWSGLDHNMCMEPNKELILPASVPRRLAIWPGTATSEARRFTA